MWRRLRRPSAFIAVTARWSALTKPGKVITTPIQQMTSQTSHKGDPRWFMGALSRPARRDAASIVETRTVGVRGSAGGSGVGRIGGDKSPKESTGNRRAFVTCGCARRGLLPWKGEVRLSRSEVGVGVTSCRGRGRRERSGGLWRRSDPHPSLASPCGSHAPTSLFKGRRFVTRCESDNDNERRPRGSSPRPRFARSVLKMRTWWTV